MAPAYGWHLENGEALRAASAEFLTPPKGCREHLQVGWNVKLVFALEPRHPDCTRERMWVEVVETQAGETYVGRLLNEPRYIDSLTPGEIITFAPEHVVGLDAPADELGYARDAWVAVNRRLLQPRRPPGRVLWNRPAESWYAFVGDEDEQERGDGNNFEWEGLDDMVDRFPALHDVFRSRRYDGCWDLDPGRGAYVFTAFGSA